MASRLSWEASPPDAQSRAKRHLASVRRHLDLAQVYLRLAGTNFPIPPELSDLLSSSSAFLAALAPPQPKMSHELSPRPTPRRITNPVLFVCDIQERFRPVIYEYPQVIATAHKMIKACSTLSIPIYATTQSAGRLGPLCAELFPPSIEPTFQFDKTEFSMLVPELQYHMASRSTRHYQVAITGIEAHICVSQTALDLVAEGHAVYVLADGVSSSHHAEAKVALDRLSRAGVIITTSEAWLYECMGNANIDKFKEISALVKESKESTKLALDSLCKL